MKRMCIILLTLVLSGCITGNYQSYSSGVGYQSEQQRDNEYYITYTGTPNTDIKKVNDFVLLRSAELTLEKGFNYFVITEAINNKKDLGRTRPSLASFQDSRGIAGSSVASRGQLSGPAAMSELNIVLFKNKPDGISYEAKAVEKALKEEYEISDESS